MMAIITKTKSVAGPAIEAIGPWSPGSLVKGARHQLLSDDDRVKLAKAASIVHFNKGEEIYGEGDQADAAFNIANGFVIAYRTLAKGEYVTSFLCPGDIFGLSEEGCYSNSTRAATPVVAYRIALPAIRRILDSNAGLDVDVIIKLCEGLREAQRHALLLVQKRAVTRLAMFLDLQEHQQVATGEADPEIYLPMDRSSIAAYLGLSLPALSRAFRKLILKKIISCRDRHHVKILNRNAFNRLADTYLIEG
jgi:CRP-like cAMP-binding protein